MIDDWRYVQEKIQITIKEEHKNEIKWKESDWAKLAESYAYENIREKLGNDADEKIKQVVYGIALYQNGKFHLADLKLHSVAKPEGDINVWLPCVSAYVHILMDESRYYHSENVLKFVIRSAKTEDRGNKEFAKLYFLLGLVLLKQRKSDEAIEAINLYNYSIEQHSGDADYYESLSKGYRYLGSAYIQKRNHHAMLDAKEKYEKVIGLNLRNGHRLVASNNLANYFINEYQNGDDDGILLARIHLEDAEKTLGLLIENREFRTDSERRIYESSINDTRAMYEIVNENFDVAIKILNDALKLLKDVKGFKPITIHYHLGIIYEHKKEYTKAKSEFLTALSFQKTHNVDPFEVAKIYDGLGIVYSKLKKFDTAKKMFREASELNPHDHGIESHLKSNATSNDKDWWSWWMQSNGKKVGLGLLCIAIFGILFLPYTNNFMSEMTSVSESVKLPPAVEKSTLNANNSTKITTTDNGTATTKNSESIDTLTVTNENSTNSVTNSEKITETKVYKYTPTEIQLGLVGILVFIILLPSIKKIKAGGVEIESKDTPSQNMDGMIITPPTL